MSASIYFSNCVLFARFHFSRSPHSLRDFIYFLKKRRGGRTKCPIAFLKKKQENEKHISRGQICCLHFLNVPHAYTPRKGWWCLTYELSFNNRFFLFRRNLQKDAFYKMYRSISRAFYKTKKLQIVFFFRVCFSQFLLVIFFFVYYIGQSKQVEKGPWFYKGVGV